MNKTLLIIGAGMMQIPAIRTAQEMGLTTVVTDYNPEALGMKLADYAIVMSTRDLEGTIREARTFHRRHGIDGVITVGTDASMTVAAVAQALGLAGIKFEAAEMATNKIKMRQRFRQEDVPSPDFRGVWTLDEAREAFHQLGYPSVIKPSDNMGARGVMRIGGPHEIEEAFRHAKSCSTSGEVIIEQFMDGPELSIDALIWNGEVILWAVADRIIKYPPYFIETGHTFPSALPPELQAEACRVMAQGIAALELTHGAAKGDLKLTAQGAKIGELAARLSGGFMSGWTYPLATGIDIIKGAIEIALGRQPSFPKPGHRVALERALIPPPGHILALEGLDEARQLPGVNDIIIAYREGDVFPTPRSNLDKLGHVIVSAGTRLEAERIAKKALDTIRVEIGPPLVDSLKEIYARARLKLGTACRACEPCDGDWCRGQVPGMGGVGENRAFRANLRALRRWQIATRTIHRVREPDTRCACLGATLDLPVIAAPITGVQTNMGGGLTEEAYIQAVVNGCRNARTLACVGDRATPGKYRINLAAIKAAGGAGIAIFKPLQDQGLLRQRLREAEQAGAAAVGIDIDSVPLVTLQRSPDPVAPLSATELKALIASVPLPFILKGILTVADARAAVRAGAAAIMVSNHGGRVLDSLPGAAAALPGIVRAVKGKTVIIADGGVRSGEDVFKYLALGADLVTIGRPLAIAAIGAGEGGVSFLLGQLQRELRGAMLMTGCATIAAIKPAHLRPASA